MQKQALQRQQMQQLLSVCESLDLWETPPLAKPTGPFPYKVSNQLQIALSDRDCTVCLPWR